MQTPKIDAGWLPAVMWLGILGAGADRLVAQDTYLALVCGRLVWQLGPPHTDTLTYVTAGTRWIDQQWLGQVVFYLVHHLTSLKGLVVLHLRLTAGAFAFAARVALQRGASVFSRIVVGLFVLGAISDNVVIRPQTFSLGLFVAVVTLVTKEQKSRSVHFVWPLLVFWANVHGAVLLGAFVTAIAFVWRRSYLLALLALMTPLASVYGPSIALYYRDLFSFPGREIITEWATPTPQREPVFIIIAIAFLFIAWRARRNGERAELPAVLLFLLLATAMYSARYIVWFGMALLMFGPSLVDAAFPSVINRAKSRAYSVACAAIGALSFYLVLKTLAQSTESLERGFPNAALETIDRETAEPTQYVVASDTLADWLLWKRPTLRGRVAFDVRFEVLGAEQARVMRRFLFAHDGGENAYEDASVLVLSSRHDDLRQKLASSTTTVYSDNLVTVLLRKP